MSSPDPRVSTCRRCKHYVLEGRRGGHCHKLNVSVQGSWQPCHLAIPAFAAPLGRESAPAELAQLVELLEVEEFQPRRELEAVPSRN